MLRAYKLLISPYFRGSCRFLPSCADYAAEAIRVHGLIGGIWLASGRLARCHPFCEAGYDPVPAPACRAGRRRSWRPGSSPLDPVARSTLAARVGTGTRR